MNAGIADAMSLSWMLAGVIKRWADEALLDAYEIERQPITRASFAICDEHGIGANLAP